MSRKRVPWSATPYTDLPRGEKASEGEQEAKKIKMAALTTTLGVEKKRNDLIKRQGKMANTFAASESGDTSQQEMPTNFIQIQFIHLFSVSKKLHRSFTEALQTLHTDFYNIVILYKIRYSKR